MNNEALSNASSKEGTPTGSSSGSQRSISTMQPHEVKLLAQRMSNEYALAKAAGLDTDKGKQHMQKVNTIKNVLIKYKESQGKSGDVSNSNTGSPVPSPVSAPAPPSTSANDTPNPSSQPSRPQSTEPSLPHAGNPQQATVNSTVVTVEKYNQIIFRSQDMIKRVQQLDELKSKEPDSLKVEAFNQEINNLNQQIAKHQTAAKFVRSQLEKQGKLAPLPDSSLEKATPPPTSSPITTAQTNNTANPIKPPVLMNVVTNPSDATNAIGSKPKGKPVPQTTTATSSPIKTTTNTIPQSKPIATANVPMPTSISGSTSVNVPSVTPQTNSLTPLNSQSTTNLPSMVNRTASALNVRGGIPGATANRINGNARPGLVTGSAHDPGFTSMPAFNRLEFGPGGQMPHGVPNNGGRVLTKRKLVELVNLIGVDEGDQKTIVDNDVEDILLDLADEFVTSVTGFACKLAKHRKVDKLDIRDFQLHLERNWGLRVPGYAIDEIKSVRKWQSHPEYKDNVREIEKAERENGNSK